MLGATMLEMFGSTETCVIATRLTAHEESWHLYPGVTLAPGADSAQVDAPWFDAPTTLQDVIELVARDRFAVRGRNSDMVEVAGKRGSLADLTRRVLAVAGVQDAVVFQADPRPDLHPDAAAAGAVRRVAALVVAPELTAEAILAHLTRAIDPAFIPRPLVLVPALPRNELGKLSREALRRFAAAHLPPRP
jgi:acyl-coenzyme A synthetase/AMP-(fatty) acid ligase